MAHKRMFSKDIVSSDAFFDMPATTQLLYFHLGMMADDDGFIGNPKVVVRSIGAGDDDLKILFSKRFILAFPSGVIVVKHWKINNTIRKDRYNETRYLEEKSKLHIKENMAYTDDILIGLPLGNQLATVGLHRIGEDRREETPASQELSNKKRTMQTNKMGKYREDAASDSFETVINADTGQIDSEPKKKVGKSKLALDCQKYYVKKGEQVTGTKPILSSAGYFIVLDAINKGGLTDVLLKRKIDDWFASGRPADELISITRCFSHNEINTWKVNNSIK